MVTKLQRDDLNSEIATVSALLARAQDQDPLGALSLRYRLDNLEAQRGEIDAAPRTAASVALVFDGLPVTGSTAINADFAGQALQDYQEMITRQVAAAAGAGLGRRGPLPAQAQHQARLNIRSLVHGSFGFLLEEDDDGQTALLETPAHHAVKQVTDLLLGVASADEGWFDERLPELDVRLFQSLRRFVTTLHRAESTLKLSEDERQIRLSPTDVERAYERVSQVEVTEEEERVPGRLLGIMPIARRFEFQRTETGEVINGRVAENLSADYLERLERDDIIGANGWVALIKTTTVSSRDGRHSTVKRVLLDLLEA